MDDFSGYKDSPSLLFRGAILEVSYNEYPNDYFKLLFAECFEADFESDRIFMIVKISGTKAGRVIAYIKHDPLVPKEITALSEGYVRTTFIEWGIRLRRIIRRR